MIFEPRSGALYADDGEFLKTVYCPMALRVKDLAELPGSKTDRYCNTCETTIKCIDEWTDSDMREALQRTPNVCVFATAAAKNIVILRGAGVREPNAKKRPVIRTARSIQAMQDASRRGYSLVIKQASAPGKFGDKYRVLRHKETGEIWFSGDYRSEFPDAMSAKDWQVVADWFFHQPETPFPLAAYMLPPDVEDYDMVYLEDVIEEVSAEHSNQGNSQRLISSTALWTGRDFILEQDFKNLPDPGPAVVG